MNKIKQYIIESFQELSRATWPTKNRAMNICILVIGFVLVATVFIAGIDFLFNYGYGSLLSYARSIITR